MVIVVEKTLGEDLQHDEIPAFAASRNWTRPEGVAI
jgi:hypothetical protein